MKGQHVSLYAVESFTDFPQDQLFFFSDYLLTAQVDKLARLLKSSLLTASAAFIFHVTLTLQVEVAPQMSPIF